MSLDRTTKQKCILTTTLIIVLPSLVPYKNLAYEELGRAYQAYQKHWQQKKQRVRMQKKTST